MVVNSPPSLTFPATDSRQRRLPFREDPWPFPQRGTPIATSTRKAHFIAISIRLISYTSPTQGLDEIARTFFRHRPDHRRRVRCSAIHKSPISAFQAGRLQNLRHSRRPCRKLPAEERDRNPKKQRRSFAQCSPRRNRFRRPLSIQRNRRRPISPAGNAHRVRGSGLRSTNDQHARRGSGVIGRPGDEGSALSSDSIGHNFGPRPE